MNTKALSFALGLGLALSSVTACAPVDDDNTGGGSQSITGGNLAAEWQRRRAAKISGCTATIIGPRHLLTASHCRPSVGDTVRFYTATSTETDSTLSRTVDQVRLPSGVNPTSNPDPAWADYTDTSNDFADIAVVRLSAAVPSTAVVATMAWLYPGANYNGLKVGAGRHNDAANPSASLLTIDDVTRTASDNEGFFHTEREQVDPGDSGGPFYRNNSGSTNRHVLGVLYGTWFDWGFRNRYTSVAQHLDFILDAMGYTGPFTVSMSGGKPTSPMASFATNSEKVCRYACENTTNCRAFSWVPVQTFPVVVSPTCYLREFSTGSVTPVAGSVTGVRQ